MYRFIPFQFTTQKNYVIIPQLMYSNPIFVSILHEFQEVLKFDFIPKIPYYTQTSLFIYILIILSCTKSININDLKVTKIQSIPSIQYVQKRDQQKQVSYNNILQFVLWLLNLCVFVERFLHLVAGLNIQCLILSLKVN